LIGSTAECKRIWRASAISEADGGSVPGVACDGKEKFVLGWCQPGGAGCVVGASQEDAKIVTEVRDGVILGH